MKRICLICFKEFEVEDHQRRGRKTVTGKLPMNRVTCSGACSRTYTQLNSHAKRKLKKLRDDKKNK